MLTPSREHFNDGVLYERTVKAHNSAPNTVATTDIRHSNQPPITYFDGINTSENHLAVAKNIERILETMRLTNAIRYRERRHRRIMPLSINAPNS